MKRIISYFKRTEVIESLIGALALAVILSAINAKAATSEGQSYEMSCRIKAKEVAAESYRGCVTESKKAQLDLIKSEYQNRIKALKDEYSEELKKISNGSDSSSSSDDSSNSNSTSNSSPTKKKNLSKKKTDSGRLVAKALPPKKVTTVSNEDLSSDSPSGESSYAPRSTGRSSDENSMDLPEPIQMDNN